MNGYEATSGPTRKAARSGAGASEGRGARLERDLLFGKMLVVSGLVDQKRLEDARRGSTVSSKPIGMILVEAGAITEEARQAIDVLVEEHIAKHDQDPQKSLMAMEGTVLVAGQFVDKTITRHPTPMADAPPPTFADYELLGEIARGGMGIVFKARQKKLNRVVALKMILSGELADDAQVARFYSEAEAAARLDHPGIVQVYEVGEVGGRHFYSMAFVDGQSLYDEVTENGPLDSRRAVSLMKAAAEAVQCAHDTGIVHRDIKPHNVLVDRSGQPKVTDFGLAKLVQGGSELTAAGQIMGTPSYMPPEQATGKLEEIGPVSDVYALGATLYFLLTGRPPFQAASAVETIRQVVDREPVPPRRLNPDIPRDVETICSKCLRKEPSKRYATASEFADDLGRWLEHRPISARPVRRFEKVWLWCKRRPTVAALMTAIVLLVSGGIFVVRERQNATYAQGLVQTLTRADTGAVPRIVADIDDYRRWCDPLLEERYSAAPDGSTEKLHLAIGLLPADRSTLDYLRGQLLILPHTQFAVVRDALLPYKNEMIEDLWTVALNDEDEARRFRAACALATYDPNDQRWIGIRRAVASYLVRVRPSELASWRTALRPVKETLVVPLAAVYRDSTEDVQVRSFATETLAEYLSDDASGIFDLFADADARQFEPMFEKLRAHGDRAIALGRDEVTRTVPSVTTDWTVRFYQWKDNHSSPESPPADWKKVLETPVVQTQRMTHLSLFDLAEPPRPPAANVPNQYFATVATTDLTLEAFEYDLFVTFDDGIRVWLDGQTVFEHWAASRPDSRIVKIQSSPGRHTLKVEHFQIRGGYALNVDVELSEASKERLATRQANAAVMLLRMNAGEVVWPLLRHRPDPRVRSYIIHWLSPRGGDAQALIDRYEVETDVTIKRALLLCLGEFDEKKLPQSERKPLIETLLAAYRSDPDPGLHAAAEWLLRQWNVPLPELPKGRPVFSQEQQRRIAQWDAEIAEIRQRLAELEEQRPVRQSEWERELVAKPPLPDSFRKGLIAHFPLDETEGADIVNAVRRDRGGGYEGGSRPARVPGVIGSSLQLDGRGQVVDAAPLRLESNTPFSYGCWFYSDGAVPNVVISTRNKDKGFRGFDLSIEKGNRLQVIIAGEPRDLAESDRKRFSPRYLSVFTTVPAAPRQWHHVFVTYDGAGRAAGVAIFLDGKPVSVSAGRDALSGTIQSELALHIGSRHKMWNLRGRIDDVRVYDRRLSPLEVRQLFHAGLRAVASIAVEKRAPPQQELLAAAFRVEDERFWHWKKQLAAAESKREAETARGNHWYVNSQGQTFVILNAGEFLMGSPPSERGRYPNEILHRRRIRRRFAVAATEVTKAQWRTFSNAQHGRMWSVDDESLKTHVLTDDSPIVAVSWYEAAWYCNWLSEQEGIPRDQWCYEPNEQGQYAAGMREKKNFWELTGYRLPTEAEWEYACRAGTVTSRYYGATETLLRKYAWFQDNSQQHTWPVASLKPNDFGLFDMLGNVQEKVADGSGGYPPAFTHAAGDKPNAGVIVDTSQRIMRGTSMEYQPIHVRSARRNSDMVTSRYLHSGFRPARTFGAGR